MSTAVNPALNLTLWDQFKLWALDEIQREGIVEKIEDFLVTVDGQEYWHTPPKKPFKVGDHIEFYCWGNTDSDRLSMSTTFREIRIIKEA